MKSNQTTAEANKFSPAKFIKGVGKKIINGFINVGKGFRHLAISLAGIFVPVRGRQQSGLGSLFKNKISPVPAAKILGFSIGFGLILGCCATFSRIAERPFYGSEISYGFGIVLIAAAVISWFSAVSPKASKKTHLVALIMFACLLVAGVALIPSTITLILAGVAAVVLLPLGWYISKIPKAWKKSWQLPEKQSDMPAKAM